MDDDALVALWLHGRPPATRRVYSKELAGLRTKLGKSLAAATLEDLQRHATSLSHLAPRSQARAVAAIRSFYRFQIKVGAIAADPSAALTAPKVPQDLAERILTEADIAKLISSVAARRDRVMLSLLYVAGLRASELCALHWRQVAPRDGGEGQITVYGKGGKTRVVLLPADIFSALVDLKINAAANLPVFPSRRYSTRSMSMVQLGRIVKRAARAAGLSGKTSPHWLRHAHASHALDRGAPVQLVRDTLGHASIATTNRYAHARPNDGSARYLARKPDQQ